MQLSRPKERLLGASTASADTSTTKASASPHATPPPETIRGTVRIQTITAAFQMDGILYELRQHTFGINCGRCDYMLSFIKRQRVTKTAVHPERGDVTIAAFFMTAYVNLLIETCHYRGVAAINGMASQIPAKDDPKANDAAIERVKADKLPAPRGHG